MSSPDLGTNPPEADTRQKLDMAVELACLTYFEALAPAEKASSALDMLRSYLPRLNDHLLELVFVCDARAKVEPDALERDNEKPPAWVDVAKRGLHRAARRVSDMRGLDRTRLFAPGQESLQWSIYYDMCERRISGGTFNADPAMTYADRVAIGEIGLGFEVIQSRN